MVATVFELSSGHQRAVQVRLVVMTELLRSRAQCSSENRSPQHRLPPPVLYHRRGPGTRVGDQV